MEKEKLSLLIVDDDMSFSYVLAQNLESLFHVSLAHSEEQAKNSFTTKTFDIILLDIQLGREFNGGLELLQEIKRSNNEAHVVMLSSRDDTRAIVDSFSYGALDFVSKSNGPEEITTCMKLIADNIYYKRENRVLKELIQSSLHKHELITEDPKLLSILSTLNRLKDDDSINILIEGESGVGKELVAHYIHGLDKRDKPLVVVDCSALAGTLIESVLFGHKKGSFTSAHEDRIGKFELAHGGDIFLDEIGTLNLKMQIKLLRFLETNEVERVGSNQVKKVKCRVIAATNENLLELVKAHTFRLDLYHRLKGFRVVIPPLRERQYDIDLLIDHFSRGTKLIFGEEVRTVLRAYPWPGNVRELKNLIKNIKASKKEGRVLFQDIPLSFACSEDDESSEHELMYATFFEKAKRHGLKSVFDMVEKEIIRRALQETKNQSTCAQLLKTSKPTLARKIKEYGLK